MSKFNLTLGEGMTIKDARCTNCGAHLELEPQKLMTKCEYCQSTIMVSQAIELALVEIDHTKEIVKHRQNLALAVRQNNIEEIKRTSQNIRDLIPNDFEALYFYAYSLSAEGKVSSIREFYNNPPEAPQETIDKVIEHMCDYSDFRDKDKIIKFIKALSPDSLSQYERTYQKRIKEEDQYAQVPRDIFICFSQIDLEVAYKVVETLEKEGYTCWLSSRNLRPNDSENYWQNIQRAIEQSQLFLVISSQSSMISKDVQKEIEIAQDHNKRMFEYKIDASPHTIFFKHVFNGIKWVDGIDQPLEKIKLLAKEINKDLSIDQSNQSNHSKFKGPTQKKIQISLILTAVILIFLVAYHFLNESFNRAELNILYLTNGDVIADGKVNQSIWEGIITYRDSSGLVAKFYEPYEITTNDYMSTIDLASEQGVEVIIGAGIIIEEIFGYAQDKYPSIQFILFNGIPRTGPNLINDKISHNTLSIFFNHAHAGFMAGYSAVMEGHYSLGYMATLPYREFIDYGIGFIAGAYYGAYRAGVEIDFPNERFVYLNQFSSDDSIYNLANEWYEDGVTLISLNSQVSLEPVLLAAENNGGMLTVFEIDKKIESNHILTNITFDYASWIDYKLLMHYKFGLENGQKVVYGLGENSIILDFEGSQFKRFSQENFTEVKNLYDLNRFKIPQNYSELREFTQLIGFELEIQSSTIHRNFRP